MQRLPLLCRLTCIIKSKEKCNKILLLCNIIFNLDMLNQVTAQDIIDTTTTAECDGKSYIMRKEDLVDVWKDGFKNLPDELQVILYTFVSAN